MASVVGEEVCLDTATETPPEVDIMESVEMQVELRLCSLHKGASSSPLRVLLLGFEIVCYAIVLCVITVARVLENANDAPSEEPATPVEVQSNTEPTSPYKVWPSKEKEKENLSSVQEILPEKTTESTNTVPSGIPIAKPDILLVTETENICPATAEDVLARTEEIGQTDAIPQDDLLESMAAIETDVENEKDCSSPFQATTPLNVKFSREQVFAKRIADNEARAGPLFMAAMQRQDYSTSIQLISTWPKIKSHRDGFQRLPLHLAAEYGNLELVRLSFSEDNLWAKSSQIFAQTPLHYSARNGHVHVVEYILDKVMLGLALHLSKPEVEKMETAVRLLNDSVHFPKTKGLIDEKIRTVRQKIDEVKLQEELYNSIQLDDPLAVRRLMTQGVELKDALWLAVGNTSKEVITDLFTLSSEENPFKGAGHLEEVRSALKRGKFKSFQLLLTLGGKDKSFVHDAMDILEQAIDQRKPEVSKYIVKENLVEAKCALELFAQYAEYDLVDWLLNNFESSLSSKSLNAALVAACRGTWNKISLSTVKKLLEKGASVDKQNNAWDIGLAQAASKNIYPATEFFLSKGARIDSGTVETVVWIGAEKVFSLFLEFDFPLPDETKPGVFGNILQTAAFQGCHTMVFEIVSRGYDINSRLGDHGSSLMLALQAGHQDIASFLISKGADVNFGIPAIGNALYFAALCGMEKVTKELVEKRADVNAMGGEFGSALQAAVVRGHVIVVLFLLDSGADVNLQGGKHGNALRAALAQGDSKVTELLLLSGARVGEEPKRR